MYFAKIFTSGNGFKKKYEILTSLLEVHVRLPRGDHDGAFLLDHRVLVLDRLGKVLDEPVELGKVGELFGSTVRHGAVPAENLREFAGAK